MDNAWKDKLRERFSDYSVAEPDGLWEGIEQGMAGKPRRTIAPIWWLSGGLAAAAAVALVVLLPGTGRQATLPERMDDVALIEPTEMQVIPADSLVTPVDEAVPETPSVSTKPTPSTPFGIISRQTLLADATVVEEDNKTESVEDTKVSPAAEEVKTVPEETIPDQVKPSLPEQAEKQVEQVVPINNDEKMALRKRYFIGVYREGGQQEAFEQSKGFGMTQTGGTMTRASDNGGETKDVVRMLSANRASSFNARHDAPVRVGVKAAFPLTNHLSLVSGLNWTSLGSDFEESTASTRNVIHQDLGYIGVPLQLEASFNPWKRLWLYAGAGGMVEKGLLAKSSTYSYIENHLENKLITHPDTGGLLWSLGASAGAEYRFNRTLGIYFAPGLEYHFDNGSGIRSAYSEHPLNWSLSFGLRFNIEK